MTDPGITRDGNLGFRHSIQNITGTDEPGHSIDRTVFVTDGYRKIGGDWLIVLEHVPVPVDLATGKADVIFKSPIAARRAGNDGAVRLLVGI